jgi:hypothetical protein
MNTVVFKCRNGEERSFARVYYIPRLMANIINVGQLDESGYDIHIKQGVMSVREPGGQLLASIECLSKNRLYVLNINLALVECLAAHGEEEAQRWHARLGHVHMEALRKMAREELVHGLHTIGQVSEVCESCMAGKQKRSSFPDQAK